MKAAARGGEEAAAPGVLEERMFYTGQPAFQQYCIAVVQFLLLLLWMLVFYPKSPHFSGEI